MNENEVLFMQCYTKFVHTGSTVSEMEQMTHFLWNRCKILQLTNIKKKKRRSSLYPVLFIHGLTRRLNLS